MVKKDLKIASKVILELLKEDDNELVCETLERMMDEELMKPDDQIDFDFIDECAKTIHILHEEEFPEVKNISTVHPSTSEKKSFTKARGNLRRFALVASIVLVVAIACNSVSAFAFHVNVFGNFIEWAQNKVIFNWNAESASTSSISNQQTYHTLYAKLRDNNLTDVMLPNYDLQKYQIKDLQVQNTDITNEVSFTLQQNNNYISYFITRFKDQTYMDKGTLLGQYSNGEQVTLNNTDYYILENEKGTSVLFMKQLTEYMLSTSYNAETTKKILETIK